MTFSDCEDDYRTGCPNVIVNSMLYLQVVIVDHYLRVIIPRYLYVINDPPCNSVYAAKRLNKRSLFIYLFIYDLKFLFVASTRPQKSAGFTEGKLQ